MANKKITDLTALTSVADGDILEIVDISDTTDAATGTNKKITKANLVVAENAAIAALQTRSHYSRTSSPPRDARRAINMITRTTTNTTSSFTNVGTRLNVSAIPVTNANVASTSGPAGLLSNSQTFTDFVTYHEHCDKYPPQVQAAIQERLNNRNTAGTSLLSQHSYASSAFRAAISELERAEAPPVVTARPPSAPRVPPSPDLGAHENFSHPGMPKMTSSAAGSRDGGSVDHNHVPPAANVNVPGRPQRLTLLPMFPVAHL